ncbi:tetratricopeptide repeat protein [Algivirga pacifica]|uniref:Tetratricopeptide repeat protein n=1 Tax=Algivirga pacifica TaxID=1162670 RepID=A0ABP9DIJ1_9BACT
MKNHLRLLNLIIGLISIFSISSCNSNNSEEQLTQAKQKIDQGKYREAISIIEEIERHSANNHEALNVKGVAYFLMQEHSKALGTFSTAIEIDSTHSKYFENRANVKRHLKDNKGAIQDYTRAIALQGNNANAFLNRALCEINTGYTEEALADFNKAEQLSAGKDMKVFFYRAKLLMTQERFEEAIVDLDKAIDLAPNHADSFYYRAMAETGANGVSDKVCELLRKANNLGSDAAASAMAEYCQ